MARLWNGNLILKEGWTLADDEVQFDGSGWAIMYFVKTENYADIKVSVRGRAENKANYWMSWIVGEGRMALGRDAKIMKANRIELFELVSGVMVRLMAEK
jgi:hypothetical protein